MRSCCMLAAGLSVVLASGQAWAQGLSLQCTNSMLIPGCTGTYEVTGSPGPNSSISSVQFRWQQTGPKCTSTWFAWAPPNQGGQTIAYEEDFVGDFTVQAQVVIRTLDYSTNPPTATYTTQTLACNVTVPPPDDILFSPISVATIPNQTKA